ncbi:hypothetical protein CKY51_16370 [Xanthomonas maliensis]|nr:hypothetical protein CKY51_16370 [Xanthomonas maliensis]
MWPPGQGAQRGGLGATGRVRQGCPPAARSARRAAGLAATKPVPPGICSAPLTASASHFNARNTL